MKSIDKTIKSFEPLMHRILHRFKITKQYYQDYLQELRIVAWQVLEKYDEKRGALSTIMQIAMQNRLKDLLRKVDNNIIYLENLSITQKNKALSKNNNIIRKIDLKIIKSKLTTLERVIIKRFLEGWTQSEISKQLNMDRLSIQRKIRKIFAKIRKLIK